MADAVVARKEPFAIDVEAGKAYWLTHDEPDTMHADVNNTGQPIEVIVVELKNDR